ncbi:UdgX family uracil-DNA binding protein [Luteimonas pelagia]
MYAANVDPPWDVDAWRAQARAALRAGLAPADVDWTGGVQGSLLGATAVTALPPRREAPAVPGALLSLAGAVVCHRDTDRHALPYRIAWRLANGARGLLDDAADPDVHRATRLAQAVRRDCHKMKAFVRFRAVPGEDEAYIAWFEPEHDIVDRVAPFFARRFAGMRWAILTPGRSVAWDGSALAFGDGATRDAAPADDAHEDLWRTYYAHIFNPARLNPTMMRSEMPQKYWRNLPEARLVPGLVKDAGARVEAMRERESEAPRRRIPAPEPLPVPEARGLGGLRAAAASCRRCPLWEPATRTVFGEGPADARIVVVGEQPGDQEDLAGRPFVGPAGRVLDRALAELGIDRGAMYLTNAVKHFRFEQRGKARLHRNPAAAHVQACRPWLEAELAQLRPDVILCLGATAARALFGNAFRLAESRGRWLRGPDGTRALATVHPSWVLRQPEAARDAAYASFVADLARLLEATGPPGSHPDARAAGPGVPGTA